MKNLANREVIQLVCSLVAGSICRGVWFALGASMARFEGLTLFVANRGYEGSASLLRLGRAVSLLFLAAAICFTVVYLPIKLSSCPLVPVAEYVENATCACKNNVAAFPLLSFANVSFLQTYFDPRFMECVYPTDAYSQYLLDTVYREANDYGSDLTLQQCLMCGIGVSGTLPNVPCAGYPPLFCGLGYWGAYYYKSSFTNALVHVFDLDVCQPEDPYHVFPSDKLFVGEIDLNPPFGVTCDFPTVRNNASYCRFAMSRMLDNPVNDTVLRLGYRDNPHYRTLCDFDYCMLPLCDSNFYLDTGLFMCTIYATMFGLFKCVHWAIFWLGGFKRECEKLLKEPQAFEEHLLYTTSPPFSSRL